MKIEIRLFCNDINLVVGLLTTLRMLQITHLLRQMFPMDTIISQWVLQNGFILIAGNHHNNTCRCVISQNPHDIQSWSKISFHHLLR